MTLLQVNSELLFVIAITAAMLLVIAFFSVYLFFLFQKRKIRLLQQQQEMKESYEQEMLKTQIEIRDQTMKDVGRELHDHIGQVLTVIKINLGQLNSKGLDTPNEDRLTGTKDLVGSVIQDLRSLSKTLNGDLIKQVGLVESIAHELNRINKLDLVRCHLEVEGEPFVMPTEKEFVAFRIVQENLNNILKHSRSSNVFTKLTYAANSFTLYQKDDGVGFNINEVSNSNTGSGLLNMQRRSELVNADLQISSQQGIGTQLTLKMNISQT